MIVELFIRNRLRLERLGLDRITGDRTSNPYEAALIEAYNFCKVNFRHWSVDILHLMFRVADRDKIQSLGSMIPREPIIAYRGVHGVGRARRVKGLSWTISLDMACWFALRFTGTDPVVHQCTFLPEDIYVIHNERGENEVIGNPHKPIKCKISTLQMKDAAQRISEQHQLIWKNL